MVPLRCAALRQNGVENDAAIGSSTPQLAFIDSTNVACVTGQRLKFAPCGALRAAWGSGGVEGRQREPSWPSGEPVASQKCTAHREVRGRPAGAD